MAPVDLLHFMVLQQSELLQYVNMPIRSILFGLYHILSYIIDGRK